MRYRSAEIIGNHVPWWDSAFQKADDLWSAFQSRLVDFITDPVIGKGQAQIMTPETNRVD